MFKNQFQNQFYLYIYIYELVILCYKTSICLLSMKSYLLGEGHKDVKGYTLVLVYTNIFGYIR